MLQSSLFGQPERPAIRHDVRRAFVTVCDEGTARRSAHRGRTRRTGRLPPRPHRGRLRPHLHRADLRRRAAHRLGGRGPRRPHLRHFGHRTLGHRSRPRHRRPPRRPPAPSTASSPSSPSSTTCCSAAENVSEPYDRPRPSSAGPPRGQCEARPGPRPSSPSVAERTGALSVDATSARVPLAALTRRGCVSPRRGPSVGRAPGGLSQWPGPP